MFNSLVISMRLVVSIFVDNPYNATVKIDKFFQVIFVDKPNIRQRRKIEIFTAIVARSSVWRNGFPSIGCEIKLNEEDPAETTDVSADFYSDIEVLQQFWGKESRKPENTTEL